MTDEPGKKRITKVTIEYDDGTTRYIDTPEACLQWSRNIVAGAELYAARGWLQPEVKWKDGNSG